MIKIGLTGSIGCGKSSLSNILKKKGIPVIDADIKGRDIYKSQKILDAVSNEFGKEIINSNGELNRKELGKIVFSSDEKLETLNSITHPEIKRMIMEDLDAYEKEGNDCVVVDAALLIEAGYIEMMDFNVVVKCEEGVQIDRIIKRDNCSENDARSRIKSQMPQEEKFKFADFIVDNSGSLENLENEAEVLFNRIKELKLER